MVKSNDTFNKRDYALKEGPSMTRYIKNVKGVTMSELKQVAQ